MARTILIALLGAVLVVWCMHHKYDAIAPCPYVVPSESVIRLDPWRRTQHGWERNTAWKPAVSRDLPHVTRLHPAVVAVLVLMVSIGALIAPARPKVRSRP